MDNNRDKNETIKKIIHPNPVFRAFDDANSVDDLYRIAEIYVNPVTYYALTKKSTISFDD